MKPYSKDLKLRVLAAVDREMPREEAAEILGVSVPPIERWLELGRETGDVAPMPMPGPQARKGEALEPMLPGQVRAGPDATLGSSGLSPPCEQTLSAPIGGVC